MGQTWVVRVVVIGTDLPGRTFCAPDGDPLDDVHVAVQVGDRPEGLVRGDASQARWELDVRTVIDADGQLDFRGPAVHGKRGERFIYLTWGNLGINGSFEMFRRAKLMLNLVDAGLVGQAAAAEAALVATVRLTDDVGHPRCARVDPPAISWATGRA